MSKLIARVRWWLFPERMLNQALDDGFQEWKQLFRFQRLHQDDE